MGVLPAYRESFFCSPERTDGLQLTMVYEEGLVSCDMNISNRFEGYTDVAHGGMLFGVLDVMIWYAIFMATKKICMTRKTEMEYFKPVLCNHPYVAKGRFLTVEERDFFSEAWIEDEHGQICARVNALFREGKDISVEEFIGKFDFTHTAPEIKDYFFSLLDEGQKAG
jgi:acyl-coenzyme A thioesterase PaaI-like protein